MDQIEATIPLGIPPSWAILERSLIDLLGAAPEVFEARFCRSDGSLIWRSALRDAHGGIGVSSRPSPDRDGGDDFYEPFRNWPLAYVLGGPSSILTRAQRHWDGVTSQLASLGLVDHDYCIGYDWFHQGEGNALFQFLALSDPGNPTRVEHGARFAAFLLNEGVPEPIYDPIHRIFRAAHVGSGGPRWGIRGEPGAWWLPQDRAGYERIPFEDLPGVTTFDDLLDPELGLRMAVAMEERMGHGDTVASLAATSAATNAFLMTGETRFRDWVVEYVDGWMERSAPFQGLVPDNVGPNGGVGERFGGRWYGANYGWTYPHGYYSVGMAVSIAAQNAHLLTGDPGYLDFAGRLIDAIWALGRNGNIRTTPMSQRALFTAEFAALRGSEEMRLVPYRHADSGWFDWQPMTLAYPTALWAASGAKDDLARAERIARASGLDQNLVVSMFQRNDDGHERPWLEFLAGRNGGYPEASLLVAHEQVRRRLDRILADDVDLEAVDVDDWLYFNPVTVEALIQLTLGAPCPLYHGGLLVAPVFYFDVQAGRPGLPPGIAALVSHVGETRVVVEFANLDPAPRTFIVQAGVYGEHVIATADYERRTSSYPERRAYQGGRGIASEPPQTTTQRLNVNGPRLIVRMLPHTRVQLDLGIQRNVGTQRYRTV